MKRFMVRMCGVRLVNGDSSAVLREKVGVAVKIKNMLVHSHLRWYSHVTHQDTNLQILEVKELEIYEKRKKRRPTKFWKFGMIWVETIGYRRYGKILPTPACWKNGTTMGHCLFFCISLHVIHKCLATLVLKLCNYWQSDS